MEFNEKLQELRKSKGLTQEELAESLFVSRTAISKWESGRGYPNIDSLKEISRFFSISIDDLLSGEKLISLAETENRHNIQKVCRLLFGIIDMFSLLLILLPLYPKTIDGFVYSVNLFSYTETSSLNRSIYWIFFLAMILIGIINVSMTYLNSDKYAKFIFAISILLSTSTVIMLALTGETYAVVVVFLLFIMKILLFHQFFIKFIRISLSHRIDDQPYKQISYDKKSSKN